MVEDAAEKKRLIGYSNPLKAFKPEPTTPCFSFPVFTEENGIVNGRLYVQWIVKGNIEGFIYTNVNPASIELAEEEIYLKIGDKALYGFDFSSGDKIRGTVAEVAGVLKGRIHELSTYPGILADVANMLGDKTFLGQAV